MNKLLIDLDELPEEGKEFSGKLEPTVFELTEKDPKPLGDFSYRLYAQRFGDELLLQGRLSCLFEMECVRTLHPFEMTLELKDAAISLEIKGETKIDATEALREELLIEMPNFPTCELADTPQDCEIDPRYLAVDKSQGDELNTPPPAGGDSRWDALDSIELSSRENPEP
ncbi:MAG: hypothetical protein Q7Q71_15070 [Verrucomicrobiota bacterium JB023]|nr:hypothetical protein [Verrucomicrobiota bacterium JB023]